MDYFTNIHYSFIQSKYAEEREREKERFPDKT